jgi:hypothetical protein
MAMAFDGGLSIVVGIGPMALMFYSGRMGYDDPLVSSQNESRA